MIQSPVELLQLIQSGLITRQKYQLSKKSKPRYIQIRGYWYNQQLGQFFELGYIIGEPFNPATPEAPRDLKIIRWSPDIAGAREDAAQTLAEWRANEIWQASKKHAVVYLADRKCGPSVLVRQTAPHISYIYSFVSGQLRRGSPFAPALQQLTIELKANFPLSLAGTTF